MCPENDAAFPVCTWVVWGTSQIAVPSWEQGWAALVPGLPAPLGSFSPPGSDSRSHPTHCREGAFGDGVRWKAHFFTPWPICITWANSWRGRALQGTPQVCRNPGFDFSNMQTICRQLQLWEQGQRDALEPSSPLMSWRGPLERPRVLTESIACTRPCGPTYLRPHSWTGCWGKTCLELGDLLDTLAKPNSPPTGSHSKPVCPVCSRPRGTMGTTCTIPPQLHWD